MRTTNAVLATAVVILSVTLTACAGSPAPVQSSSELSGELHVLAVAGPTASWIEAAAPVFEKLHPNLKIVQSTETNQNLLASAAQLYSSDSAPDLGFMQINMSAYPLLRDAGELQKLNDVWAGSDLAANLPQSIANGPWKNGADYYGIPSSQVWAPVIYYNKKLFADAGISISDGYRPTDTEFLQWAATFKSSGREALAVGAGEFPAKHMTAAILQSKTTSALPWDAYLANQPTFSGQQIYSQGPFLDALKQVDGWNKAGVFARGTSSMTAAQADSLFAAGSAAMLSDGSFAVKGIKSSSPTFDIGWMVYPTAKGGTPTTLQLYAGSGFVVPAKSKNAAAAFAFAKFLASTEGMQILAGTGNIPTRTDVPTDSFKGLDPVIVSMFSKFEEVGTSDIWSPNQAVETALTSGVGELLIGQTTPEKLAADIQTAVEAAAK